ncbi:hypothetical protein HDV00_010736 [Rhizophlyctis rosea]|nr:hypothetical protein HDV00_010736 [Rhizophlyctis rosea]
MSERWVSNKKFFCKYCQIYIQDNKPSRTLHEQGRKHKEAVEAFLQGIHKNSEEKQREDLERQMMLEKINNAAAKQFATETGSKYKPSPTSTSTSSKSSLLDSIPTLPSPPPYAQPQTHTPTQFSHFTPKFEPKALPTSDTSDDAPADPYGGWTVISETVVPTPEEKAQAAAKEEEAKAKHVEEDDDDEEPEEHVRGFKIREKVLAVEVGDDGEGGDGPVTFKKRKCAGKGTRNIRKKLE